MVKERDDHHLLNKKHYIVTRHIKLASFNSHKKEQILSTVRQLIGVDSVTISDKNDCLTLQYDASKRQLSDFECVLSKYQCRFSTSKVDTFKLGWYRFVDNNIYNNALQDPTHINELNI